MERKPAHVASICLGVMALLCWLVMFLAGTDIWHDVGRPDFWRLQGPTYQDLRAFAYSFYLLPVVLSAHLIVTILGFVRARRPGHGHG